MVYKAADFGVARRRESVGEGISEPPDTRIGFLLVREADFFVPEGAEGAAELPEGAEEGISEPHPKAGGGLFGAARAAKLLFKSPFGGQTPESAFCLCGRPIF